MVTITSLYAAPLAVIFLALSFRVIAFRRGNRVSLGDADNPDLRQRVRGQANFVEYAPFGLILLALVELQGAPALALHALGLMLLVGRLLHAICFWQHPMPFKLRTWGMLLTTGMIGLTAVGLFLHALI
ncbi:MAPEG family protein [Yoonia sp. 208BN28-4]|uniref:MAPEG family protein n=1 Tax=Yoonia sp. 208BN28-4 TaxID=3126505 RepID=UPI0030AA37BC